MDILKIEQHEQLRREEVAARLRRLADMLDSHNDLELERNGMRLTVHLPDELRLKLELELETDESELEIELKWQHEAKRLPVDAELRTPRSRAGRLRKSVEFERLLELGVVTVELGEGLIVPRAQEACRPPADRGGRAPCNARGRRRVSHRHRDRQGGVVSSSARSASATAPRRSVWVRPDELG